MYCFDFCQLVLCYSRTILVYTRKLRRTVKLHDLIVQAEHKFDCRFSPLPLPVGEELDVLMYRILGYEDLYFSGCP